MQKYFSLSPGLCLHYSITSFINIFVWSHFGSIFVAMDVTNFDKIEIFKKLFFLCRNSDLSAISNHHCVARQTRFLLRQDSIELCLAHVNHCKRSQRRNLQKWVWQINCHYVLKDRPWISGLLELAISILKHFDIANIGYIGEYTSLAKEDW